MYYGNMKNNYCQWFNFTNIERPQSSRRTISFTRMEIFSLAGSHSCFHFFFSNIWGTGMGFWAAFSYTHSFYHTFALTRFLFYTRPRRINSTQNSLFKRIMHLTLLYLTVKREVTHLLSSKAVHVLTINCLLINRVKLNASFFANRTTPLFGITHLLCWQLPLTLSFEQNPLPTRGRAELSGCFGEISTNIREIYVRYRKTLM